MSLFRPCMGVQLGRALLFLLLGTTLFSCAEKKAAPDHAPKARVEASDFDAARANYRACRTRLLAEEEAEGPEVTALRKRIVSMRDALATSARASGRSVELGRELMAELQALLDQDRAPFPRRELELTLDLLKQLEIPGRAALYERIARREDAGVLGRLLAAEGLVAEDARTAGEKILGWLAQGTNPEGGAFENAVVRVFLSRAPEPARVPFLIAVLQTAVPAQARLSAAFEARRVPAPALVPVLRRAAENDPKPFVRVNAVQTLALFVGEKLVPSIDARLAGAIEDPREREGLLEARRAAAGRQGPLSAAWE